MSAHLETQPPFPSKDPASILTHFPQLPDPRREHGRLHRLDEIVFLAWVLSWGGPIPGKKARRLPRRSSTG
jgi:hypothetical protein